ncbi:EAL domain-containing protein [Fusibacter sp. 3D3]|uniref:EAL domain-containing protein n=1 Tax=Fusibacter sp. 3D3 TaxID=1048380 RepID=UPI001585D609|nr:EAL domain-containing protein [Fusibacter sp. 3D3]
MSIILGNLTDTVINFATEAHRVLFINSYNWAYDTVPEQLDGVRAVLEAEGIALDIEYMDTKRFDDAENYEHYYNFLKYRLDHGEPYDVILVSDDNALKFLIDHREALVKEASVVFFGINDSDRVNEAAAIKGFYGLYETTSIKENLDLAKALQPEADEFLIVTDRTTTGIGDSKSYLKYREMFPDMTFSIVNFSEYSLEAFQLWLQGIKQNQILIYMTMMVDADENVYTMNEAIAILAQYANVPVFRPTIGGVGKGLLGGYMKSYEKQGRIAAEAAVNIINGDPMPVDSLILERPNQYVVDYNIMKKFNLNMAVLPEETIIINSPLTLYEQYRTLLVPLALGLSFLMVIVVALVFDNHRRRLVELKLRGKNLELSGLFEELMSSEEELREQNQLLSQSRQQLSESEQRYKELAYSDILTGLNNRIAMYRALNHLIADRAVSGALYFIDLDQFKYINDSRGHLTGDAVLCIIGERLKRMESDQVIANRLGGDEFVLIVHESNPNHEMDQLFINRLFGVIEEAVYVEQQEFYLTCSIGIVKFPEQGRSANELIRKADIAMYKAKEAGRARAIVYNDFMHSGTEEILEMQKHIRHALEKNEFRLFLQPQINLDKEVICGFEGLIRWEKEDGHMISPLDFIPVAERLGIIHRIGQWVLKQACDDIQYFAEMSYSSVKIAVNVSAIELTRADFDDDFMKVLEACNINPNQIVIELTESSLLEISETHLKKLKSLRDKGIEIHLDDFGTGYSSLNYLRHLPIDVVKIDREFIKDVAIYEAQMLLTKSIIEIVHNLGKTVIAEGVETKEQVDILREMGCDRVQGYYYARPMCLADAAVYLKTYPVE